MGLDLLKENYFQPGDRYQYDFELCSYKKGYSQLDSGQDAWYFGTWVNPYTCVIVNYAEGDVYITRCSEREFVEEIRKIEAWNLEHGHGQIHIDPGFSLQNKEKFVRMGLGDLVA